MSSRAIALLASGISQQSPQRVLTSMPKGLSFLRILQIQTSKVFSSGGSSA